MGGRRGRRGVGSVAVAADQMVERLARPVLDARRRPLGQVGEVDALGRRRHHDPGQAGARFPQLEGEQGPLPAAEAGGQLRQTVLAEHRRRIGAEPPPQLGIAEEPLDQLSAAPLHHLTRLCHATPPAGITSPWCAW